MTLGIRDTVRAIVEAADVVCKAQTPPRGGNLPHYVCPACSGTRSTRREFRAHLALCEPFREAAVRRASRVLILPGQPDILS